MLVLLAFGLYVGVSTARAAVAFPPDVTICSANDPNINQCFMDSGNKYIPTLGKGDKKLGIVPLDPLVIPKMILERGNNILPSLAFNLTDYTTLGVNHMRIVKANIKPKEYLLNISTFLSTTYIKSMYDVDGSIAAIPIQGSGKCNFTIFNSTFNIDLVGEPVKRNNETYMTIKNLRMDCDVDDARYQIDNLFNNKFISDSVNALLNLASKVVVKSGLVAMQELLGSLTKDFLQRMFYTIPYNKFFTDVD